MSDGQKRLMTIMASVVDETASDDELRELNDLLDGNLDNQLLYKRYLDLHCRLELSSNPSKESAAVLDYSRQKSSRRFRHWTAVAAGIGGIALLLMLILSLKPRTPAIEAALGDFEGDVVVTRADGELSAVSRGMDIHAGDAIETRGNDSFASLEFSDRSRFVLVSDSATALDESNLKTLLFRGGRLIAFVKDSSAADPFVVAAPYANVRILRTKFALESRRDQTNLKVLEGRVDVTSHSAKNSVEVLQGEYLVAHEDRPFVVEDTSSDAGWSEDFENGLPENWRAGKFESNGLPEASKGGVRTAKNIHGETVLHEVTTQKQWARGLFQYRDDLHLHITFKMDQPSWINVFFISRTNDPKNHKTFLHKFDAFPVGKAGQWCKVTIPLSEFHAQTNKGFEKIPPSEDELVFGFNFSAPEPDRGLVIDELSVIRGGPGKVEFERLD